MTKKKIIAHDLFLLINFFLLTDFFSKVKKKSLCISDRRYRRKIKAYGVRIIIRFLFCLHLYFYFLHLHVYLFSTSILPGHHSRVNIFIRLASSLRYLCITYHKHRKLLLKFCIEEIIRFFIRVIIETCNHQYRNIE